ncbi:Uncharacterised protein [Mycobacteroides abscessus subsp. abscessus]|nr:Uncharacterised protein [Mycobacteroides abscessus subsp. abscessus]
MAVEHVLDFRIFVVGAETSAYKKGCDTGIRGFVYIAHVQSAGAALADEAKRGDVEVVTLLTLLPLRQSPG